MQARYWLLTIPQHEFTPYLPPGTQWLRGQLERGNDTGYLHWQLVVGFANPTRLAAIKRLFGDSCHAEKTRSAAADSYVFKEDTSVEGTRFELGTKPISRASKTDWDKIRESAKSGRFDDIPADIYIRCYHQLKTIAKDHLRPEPLERSVYVFWGTTGTGKSRRAWDEASFEAYPKDPRSKFWDGYQGQENVVIDEFRGGIDISHMLRWTDRYPTIIEAKHGATILRATKIWITSNLSPTEWYPDIDEETKNALMRRLTITHFSAPFNE